MIPGLTEEEERDLILSVGTHMRERRLSPMEVAELFERAIAHGANRSQLASACHLEGATAVGRFLRLTALPDRIRPLVDWGSSRSTLSTTQAQDIARLNSQAAMEELAVRVLEHGLSSKEVRYIVQLIERSASDVEEAVQAQLELRPEVRRLYVFLGLVTSDTAREKLKGMTQDDRDRTMRQFLVSCNIVNLEGRLGSEQFALVGAEADVGIDQLEKQLNAWLAGQPW